MVARRLPGRVRSERRSGRPRCRALLRRREARGPPCTAPPPWQSSCRPAALRLRSWMAFSPWSQVCFPPQHSPSFANLHQAGLQSAVDVRCQRTGPVCYGMSLHGSAPPVKPVVLLRRSFAGRRRRSGARGKGSGAARERWRGGQPRLCRCRHPGGPALLSRSLRGTGRPAGHVRQPPARQLHQCAWKRHLKAAGCCHDAAPAPDPLQQWCTAHHCTPACLTLHAAKIA